jgi:WD40 repeat protein
VDLSFEPSSLFVKTNLLIREYFFVSKNICLESMRCDTPHKQFGGSINGAVISIQAMGESVYVIHSDFTVCNYKLRGLDPVHFKLEKAKIVDSKGAIFTKRIPSDFSDKFNGSNEAHTYEQRSKINASFAMAHVANSRLTGKSSSNSEPSHIMMSCGYFDDSIKIHTLDSLQLKCSLHGCHRGKINCLEVGGEGETLVTGGDDATCRLWIIDHDALALAITDGFVKSSLSQDRSERNKCYHVHTLLGHETPVSCVAICTKLDVVLSGALGGSICIHKVRSGKFIRSFYFDASSKEVQESSGAGNGIPVRKLCIHVDGSFVAHLSDCSMHHISVNGQQLCRAHIGEALNAMVICPKSEAVITGGELGCVRIWNLHDFSLLCTVDVKKHGPITSLALTRGVPQFLCVGSGNGLTSIVSRIPAMHIPHDSFA